MTVRNTSLRPSRFIITRVNTEDHPTEELAKSDLAWIIERGYFWKKSSTIQAPVGSLIIGMGSHGGRGLYLVGIVSGRWENEPDGGEYKKRLPVVWQRAIYQHPAESVDKIAAMVTGFNYRFGAHNPERLQFISVLSYVLSGIKLDPDYHWETSQAA